MSMPRRYRNMTRNELLRWGTCFVAMLSLHGAVAGALLMTPEEGDTFDTVTAIEVDFTTESFRDAEARDVAPGEEQMQTDEAPPPQEKAEVKTEKVPEPEPPLPQVAEPDVALETTPEKKQEEEKKEEKEKTPNATPPLVAASATTAPTAAASRKAQIVSWKRKLALHLQRSKRYPHEAQKRHETGTSRVSFVVDRQGHVISSRIVKGSGSDALDRETLDLLQRAQPLPKPPNDVGGTQFAFTMPILFEFR